MPYFQLRITFSELRTPDTCLLAIRRLIRHYNLKEHSLGLEQLNKYGEPCDPHLHFNFIADIERVNPKRCVQDWLRRWFSNRDIELRGNRMWSLQMVEEPADYDRWFRYPIKEELPEYDASGMAIRQTFFKKEGMEGAELRAHYMQLRQRAVDERRTSIEHNILRREKLRVKDQFKQKMYDFIAENAQENNKSKEYIWCLIFEYYRKIEKPINFSVIEGYTNLWLADHGQLSPQSAYNLAHNNNSN